MPPRVDNKPWWCPGWVKVYHGEKPHVPTNTVPLCPQSCSPRSQRASCDGPEAKARQQSKALVTSAARCLLTALIPHGTHARPDQRGPRTARTVVTAKPGPGSAQDASTRSPSQLRAAARPPEPLLPGNCPSSGKGASAQREAPVSETAPGLRKGWSKATSLTYRTRHAEALS